MKASAASTAADESPIAADVSESESESFLFPLAADVSESKSESFFFLFVACSKLVRSEFTYVFISNCPCFLIS